MRALLRTAIVMVTLFGLAGCSAGDSTEASPSPSFPSHGPVTLTVWLDNQTDAQVQALTDAADRVHSKDSNLSVTVVRGKSEDDLIAAVKSLQPPDIYISQSAENVGSYCYNGTMNTLISTLSSAQVNLSDIYPSSVLGYTSYEGAPCAFPLTADPLVLYYRQDMLDAAGIDGPPHTLSAVSTDLEKLTVRNADGSISRWGFTPPVVEYGDNADLFIGGQTGAQFYDDQGKSTLASNQVWPEMLRWQQSVLSYYGSGQVDGFISGYGGDSVANGPFVAGTSAMEIARASDLATMQAAGDDVRVAPAPVPDSREDIYGAGSVVGDVAYVPSGTDHATEAVELLTDLASDRTFMTDFAEGGGQVPASSAALKSGQWKSGSSPQATFAKIVRDDDSFYKTPEASAPQDRDSWIGFITSWEHGDITDVTHGLSSEATTIDGLNAIAYN